MTSLTLYTPPAAIQRAYSDRHYCPIQLAAHAAAKARAARMSAPCPIAIVAEPEPPPVYRQPKTPERYPYPDQGFSTRQHRRQKIVVHEVACEWCISDEELIGVCRRRKFVEPRMVAMWFFRTILKMPMIRIGRALPNGTKGYARDHSTVCNAIAWVGLEMAENPEFSRGLSVLAVRITDALALDDIKTAAPAMKVRAAVPS